MKKISVIIIFFCLSFTVVFCQNNSKNQDNKNGANIKKEYKALSIAFYNVENLFDTIADPNDSEFTPQGPNHWNSPKYYEKLSHIASVISQIGKEETGAPPAVIGLSEIENISVLEDLVKQEALGKYNYQIVHRDGSDLRGVDCALLYRPEIFKVSDVKMYKLISAQKDFITRDQITITGDFDGEEMTFIVLHYPSRRGGEKRSSPRRIEAAELTRKITDSIFAVNPLAKIVVMGDLNDDPTDISIKKYLRTTDSKEKAIDGTLYNPMEVLFKKGVGSLAYNDKWNLFDQIIISPGFLIKNSPNYIFYNAKVFKKSFLLQKEGRFKGYTWRTYVGNTYQGGYSDHLPTYIIIVKEKL